MMIFFVVALLFVVSINIIIDHEKLALIKQKLEQFQVNC